MRDTISSLAKLGPEVEALSQLSVAVFRLNGLLLQWGDGLVAPLRLTSARWQMLGALALAGTPLTAPQVGDVMGVTRQGAQKQLNLLHALGLVEPKANPAHQRSSLYCLTPEGRKLYEKAEKSWAREAATMARKISVSQAKAATATLVALQGLLDPSTVASDITR